MNGSVNIMSIMIMLSEIAVEYGDAIWSKMIFYAD